MNKPTKTLKVRIKDKHIPVLRQWARSVNTVWNYVNELSSRSIKERGKIANRRKDALHKFSRQLVDRCGEIYVGNVSSSKLVKTKMAKSVLDAGWAMLKTMLEYKGAHAGIVVREVNESFSTQACSECGSISGPKGLSGLAIREWTCPDCGAEHQRDVNSAKIILGRGRAPLAVGIPFLQVGEDVNGMAGIGKARETYKRSEK